uniref:BUD13 homolog n=1 Tax=Terrapene triunguis TaxID=2587831 RepID=A0A674IIP7_9SAUR
MQWGFGFLSWAPASLMLALLGGPPETCLWPPRGKISWVVTLLRCIQVAEFIDERPEEVKRMEEFRTNSKWKLLGGKLGVVAVVVLSPAKYSAWYNPHKSLQKKRAFKRDLTEERWFGLEGVFHRKGQHGKLHMEKNRGKIKHSSDPSPRRRGRHDSPEFSPPRKQRHDSSDESLSRNQCRDSPDLSDAPQTLACPGFYRAPNCISSVIIICYLHIIAGFSPANKKPKQAPSPKRRKRHDSDSSLARKSSQDSSDSDLSPLRNSHRPGLLHRDSPSKLSPPKRNQNTSSDSDLSPPRRSQMLSGGKAGLVSADLLRREQQELRRHDRNNKHLEDESQNAETVFRDKSGRKRDLMQERLEQQKKAEAKSERDELYAKWGKGLAQSRQQQQNVEDAVKEMQKPLARYIDDQDLDQMLREKEREGDPMANFIRKKKAKESKDKKEKPRYNGPAPPLNRFNLWPGYRWDGVDRSNGFEQKRFARLASKKAVQELAYKWSVEDM